MDWKVVQNETEKHRESEEKHDCLISAPISFVSSCRKCVFPGCQNITNDQSTRKKIVGNFRARKVSKIYCQQGNVCLMSVGKTVRKLWITQCTSEELALIPVLTVLHSTTPLVREWIASKHWLYLPRSRGLSRLYAISVWLMFFSMHRTRKDRWKYIAQREFHCREFPTFRHGKTPLNQHAI